MLARCILSLAAAATLAAQTAEPAASLSGTVTNSVTGEPILRAHVAVHCPSPDMPQSERTYGALSDEKGAFAISAIAPGNCWAAAERVGFVAPRNAASYTLASGAHKEGSKLTLIPAGVIAGHVLNAAGEAVQGVQVSAEMGNGNSRNSSTDDKGQFRIGGLYPGKYRVKATPQSFPFPPEIRSDGSVEQKDAATYYPDSLDSKTAQPVEIKAGTEAGSIDIKLVRTPIVRISGIVADIPAGVKNLTVTVQPRGQGGSVKADGTFAIWRLDPGKYTLQAQLWGQTPMMSTPVDIEVTSLNLDHVELRMVPPFEMAGQLRFDDDQAREAPKPPVQRKGAAPSTPPPVARRVVLLLPMNGQNVAGVNAKAGPDDAFTLEKVQPARYHVRVEGVSGYVKSIRMGEKETDGDILDVRTGAASPLTVTLSSNYCEISGTVSDSNGPVADSPVVLVPVNDPSRAQIAHSDSAGTYKFRVPPGKYKFALVEEDSMMWGMMGPDLEDYAPESLDLTAGDKIAKDLVRRK